MADLEEWRRAERAACDAEQAVREAARAGTDRRRHLATAAKQLRAYSDRLWRQFLGSSFSPLAAVTPEPVTPEPERTNPIDTASLHSFGGEGSARLLPLRASHKRGSTGWVRFCGDVATRGERCAPAARVRRGEQAAEPEPTECRINSLAGSGRDSISQGTHWLWQCSSLASDAGGVYVKRALPLPRVSARGAARRRAPCPWQSPRPTQQ